MRGQFESENGYSGEFTAGRDWLNEAKRYAEAKPLQAAGIAVVAGAAAIGLAATPVGRKLIRHTARWAAPIVSSWVLRRLTLR